MLGGNSRCGMAGSFGYEAEHYEVSMQMADGAQREAAHVARLLAGQLA